MRMGLAVTRFDWPGAPGSIGSVFGHLAKTAEEAGFGSLWVMDHFFQIPLFGPPEQEMLEGYSALAFAAAKTEKIGLGTLVTGVTHRHPGVLVKTATTLDVLSGGRAWLGIGAAGYEEDHAGLGIPLPPTAERFERLEETLRIARQMWAGEDGPFEGEHYRLGRTLNSPNPVNRPHPPILVGGGGEKKTLRLVARYADACNLFDAFGVAFVRDKLSVLRGHCETERRPYEEVEKTTYGRLAVSRDGAGYTETPAQAIERYHALAEEGVDHAIVTLADAHEEGAFDLVAEEVIPAVEEFVPAGR